MLLYGSVITYTMFKAPVMIRCLQVAKNHKKWVTEKEDKQCSKGGHECKHPGIFW